MTGNVNYPTLKGPTWPNVDVGFTDGVANELRLTNAAHQQGVLRNLRVDNLILHGSISLLDEENIYGQGNYATCYNLYAGTSPALGGVVATIHARSAEGVDDHRIDISRAGDIIPAANSVYDLGALGNVFAELHVRDGFFTNSLAIEQSVSCNLLKLGIQTDATRGDPGSAGRVIYNSDDVGLNIDDGISWRDTNGNIT